MPALVRPSCSKAGCRCLRYRFFSTAWMPAFADAGPPSAGQCRLLALGCQHGLPGWPLAVHAWLSGCSPPQFALLFSLHWRSCPPLAAWLLTAAPGSSGLLLAAEGCSWLRLFRAAEGCSWLLSCSGLLRAAEGAAWLAGCLAVWLPGFSGLPGLPRCLAAWLPGFLAACAACVVAALTCLGSRAGVIIIIIPQTVFTLKGFWRNNKDN